MTEKQPLLSGAPQDNRFSSYSKMLEDLFKRIKSNKAVDRSGLALLLIFIIVAAACQALPSTLEGGTEEVSERYKLFLNYLTPEIRELLLGNGNTVANLAISAVSTSAFAGLALSGFKALLDAPETTGNEIKGWANTASKFYAFLASFPGAFMTAAFFSSIFEHWPFNDVALSAPVKTDMGYGAGLAILLSNFLMYGPKSGQIVASHLQRVVTATYKDTNWAKRFVLPIVYLYMYYMLSLQQGASLAKQLKPYMPKELAIGLAVGPSLAFPGFVVETLLEMVDHFYQGFLALLSGQQKKTGKTCGARVGDLLKLIVCFIIFLPMLAMYMYFSAKGVENVYGMFGGDDADNISAAEFNTTLAGEVINNQWLNMAHIVVPSLLCTIISLYHSANIPGDISFIMKRMINGPSRPNAEASINNDEAV